MAEARLEIINTLRNVAVKLKLSADYQWGHMGACNCGFLAQEITKLKKNEIHHRAMRGHGDWNEQLNDYCPTSGLLMDDLISQLVNFGFTLNDLKHLEKLSDPRILDQLPNTERHLKYNIKDDVFKYINAWASLLEDQLIDNIALSDLTPAKRLHVPSTF